MLHAQFYTSYSPRREHERQETLFLFNFLLASPPPLHPTFCPISTYSKDVFNSYFHQRIHTADRPLCHLPGDVVRWASRDAGFNRVTTIHTHCVKGLVFTVPKGIEVDVGLRSSSGARLTWIHTNAMKTKRMNSPVATKVTYSSCPRINPSLLPVGVTSSGTDCPDGFKFWLQCPATVTLCTHTSREKIYPGLNATIRWNCGLTVRHSSTQNKWKIKRKKYFL